MSVGYERADVSQPAAIEAMFASVLAGSGQVGLLVNKAGIQHVPPVDDFPVAKRDAIMAINLSAAFHTVHHVSPGMKSQRWGRILNIASAHALLASPYDSAFEGGQTRHRGSHQDGGAGGRRGGCDGQRDPSRLCVAPRRSNSRSPKPPVHAESPNSR